MEKSNKTEESSSLSPEKIDGSGIGDEKEQQQQDNIVTTSKKKQKRPKKDENKETKTNNTDYKNVKSFENNNNDDDDDDKLTTTTTTTKNETNQEIFKRKSSSLLSFKEKQTQKQIKVKQRQQLLQRVPHHDEHGIAYNKQQIRRMCKRVSRGLPPLETEDEKIQRQQQDALLCKQEQAELYGMIYQNDGTIKAEDDDDDDDDDERPHEEKDEDSSPVDQDGDTCLTQELNGNNKNKNNVLFNEIEESSFPRRKKTRRSKPVPADYVCQACQNKETPPLHWIYDCPLKVTRPGCNQKSTKQHHINEPSDQKVFISGLPFDTKAKDVRQLLSGCGIIRHIKLLTFEDTGRCKGTAFITFENKEAAVAALQLSGTPLDNNNNNNNSSTDGDKESSKRKTLTLKVSKVLNRTLTKKRGG